MSLYPNIDQLDKLTFWWLKNGVRKLKRLLKSFWNQQDRLQVFHVAGTNGKGSTCQMLSQVLWKEFGYKVGLTISPHMITIHERVQINGVGISDEDLNTYLGKIFALSAKKNITLSFFESMILVALLYFSDQQVDYAVIEVGLWGKNDATNVFKKPLATLITTISDDHRQLLWPTTTHIFWNKAGILKKWVPCFTRLDTKLMHYAAKAKWAPLYSTDQEIATNLAGNYQQQNAGLAFHCLSTLGFDPDRLRAWLKQITHPWRAQWLDGHILLDGAHNEEWLQAFLSYVQTITDRFSRIVTVFWTTKTREDYPWFFTLCIAWDVNYLVMPSIEDRAIPPENYQHHLSFQSINAKTLPDLWDNLPRNEPETLVIVYGSLYLVGEFLQRYTSQSSR
jgi:dihydrofolate synthase/folylpolyglutamate synthase